MSERNPNALQVWLAGSQRPAGWLVDAASAMPAGQPYVTVPRYDSHSGSITDERRLPLTWRSQVLERFDVENSRALVEAMRGKFIPPCAIAHQNPNHNSQIYRWPVVSLEPERDAELLEWLFEAEQFEPADTEPDIRLQEETFWADTVDSAVFTGGKMSFLGSTLTTLPIAAAKLELGEIPDKLLTPPTLTAGEEALNDVARQVERSFLGELKAVTCGTTTVNMPADSTLTPEKIARAIKELHADLKRAEVASATCSDRLWPY